MKDTLRKGTIVIMGIALNVLGRSIAGSFRLPLWFDMVGTFIASYFTGIWGGLSAAVFSSLILGFFDVTAYIYVLTGMAAALMIHVYIKKGYMDNLLRAVVASFWLGILCTVVSTPLNLTFYSGYSKNPWGDTLVDMLRWYDVSDFWSALAGEAIVEIIDKQACVLITYLIIHVIKRFCDGKGKHGFPKYGKSNGSQSSILFLAIGSAVLFLLQPLSVKAAAQEQLQDNIIAKVYNNTNGMMSSGANVICETEDGFIWIGSYAGLTRYDGSEFEFIREGGLANVVGMMTDSRGRLWIGTNDAGIARYEKGKYTYFTDKDGLPSNSIRCFAEDEEGNVYVGTSGRICKFSPDDEIEILKQDITFVKSMTVYRGILIVMDNNGGLYALDGEETKTIIDENAAGLFYYCLASTSEGLLAGTDTGELFSFDVSEQGLSVRKQIDIAASQILALFEDSRNRIWIATESEFGYRNQGGSYQRIYGDGFSGVVWFHEDYQGNIWAASSHYGVMQLSESLFTNLFEQAGMEEKVVNAVTCYRGDYYCGTDNGLVILDGRNFSEKTNVLTEVVGGHRVRALFEDSQKRLWICTYSGLVCYDPDKGIRLYDTESDGTTSNRFRCMTELKDGTFVVGTADGINFIKDGEVTGTLTAEDGLSNTQILSIVESSDGTVWAGSDGSGIYVISGGRLTENYTVKDGLSADVILRIIPHEDGYFIVTSNALCHIDLDGNIKKLENFPYFNNFDIIIDGEIAYITCSAGMYEMKVSDLCADTGQPFLLYSANQGLSSGLTANAWNYAAGDGRLYLCSNNGVIVFDGSSENTEVNMKFGICSFMCDGTEIEAADENSYVIPADTKNISIYASVKNYAFTDAKVRFYVEELEQSPRLYEWYKIEPIQLFKEDFSEYHIRMQIFDSFGETVLQEKTVTLKKDIHAWEKPEYKTYLIAVCFEIFVFTIISIAGMTLFILRKNELEKNQIELEKRVREQTGELELQQKRTKELFLQTVTALSEAVDAKDRYTSGHSKRVAKYALLIATRMGKSKEEQEAIYRAGLLHDVGKIRVPAEIINKPGKLTTEEYNVMKIHPITGYHILRGISKDNFISNGARFHHERYDGKGYPNGLAGDKIPEVARILAVADSYDAMTSNRSYRSAMPQKAVRKEIESGRGTQFDPDIAGIMLQMIDEDKEYVLKQADSMHRKILTVDDEAMNNKIIAHIMSDEPMYEVVSAGSGKEALMKLEQQSFDLILLDVNMPDMDGMETLKRIREKCQTPIALMTSDKTLDITAEFAAYGCDDYIIKPFFPLLVKEVVHNMTERTKIEN